MLKLALLLLTLTLLNATLTELPSEQLDDTPKLPLYVGRSYNLLEGNPLSSKVDPGFMHSIFDFTYDKQQKTQDGKYLVPDGISHRKQSSCSFTTDTQTYRGTKSYQTQLKTQTKISGGYKGLIVDAAFSFSTAYQHMQKQTTQTNMSVTHASAQCQAYQLSIDIFTISNILPNFIAGVNQSYHSKNWNKFITQFGTHYVYDVTMGGRAVQEISYTYQSVSKLNALNVDISVAAKASYAKFFGDTSFDWHRHTEEIAYSQKESKTIAEIYVGGQPPKNGNIHQWVDQVIQNPMPIHYKVIELSDLFSKLTIPGFNVAEAVSQFHTALDNYCQQQKCKIPSPDHPKPPPAKNQEVRTQTWGGNGGNAFEFKLGSTTANAVKFLMLQDNNIVRFQMLIGDGIRSQYTPAQGGTTGKAVEWSVPDGQHVTQVQYRYGSRVTSLVFITNTGLKSPMFGGGGGTYHLETFPADHRIIGFYGRSGLEIDQLGFILAKTIYPSTGQSYIETVRTQLLTE